MNRVRECFAKDEMLGIQTAGTNAYLEMLHKYIDIFYSTTLTLLQRCRNASYVISFLRLWRLVVLNDKCRKTGQKNYTLKKNCITKQSFDDFSISCHSAALLIRASRDLANQHPVAFSSTGSDCCEHLFSDVGAIQQGGNRRTYTAREMGRM